MKRLFLSLSLFMGTAAMQADTLQDFLVQSGSAQGYEQLTVEQKEVFNAFWSKIEGLCVGCKDAFTRLTQDDQEGLGILKQLLGQENINLSISLMAESEQ
jgi:hypothetical protein